MNFEKALRTLDLNLNFTEEELKKAHRELVNKYHSDRNKSPEAEDKMKDINEAREYLAKYLKNKSENQHSYTYKQKTKKGTEYQSTFDIEVYILRSIYIKKIFDIIEFDFNEYKVSENIKYIIRKIASELYFFEIRSTYFKKEDIDNIFNICLQNIKKLFKELKDEFFKENGIYENDIKEIINYDCTLKELYEQLLKIRYKYSNSNLNNSQVYIKRKDKYERLFDYTSFFYLEKDKMHIYQLSDSTIFDKRNITQQELDENYISLDELLDISEYVGKWMIDVLSGKKEYIYYKADGYIIYQCLDSENISIIITPPEHQNCEQKDTPFISDKFKDKKLMQDLIEKQIEQRIKEKEKQFLPPSPHPYAEHYLSNINNDSAKSQINKDDTNGYNNSRKRR